MQKIYFILFGSFLISIIGRLHAQLQIHSISELIQYADRHAIALKSAAVQQHISISQERAAKSYLYPNINGTAGFNDNLTLQPTLVPEQLFNSAAPEGSFKEMKFGKQYMYSAGVQAQWDFLDFQKMISRKIASLQVKSDQSNTQRLRFNIYNQLAATYYSILMDIDALHIYQQNVLISTEMLSIAKEKYGKGIISEADYNQADMQNLKNIRDVAGIQQDMEALYRQLQIQLDCNVPIVVSNNDSIKNSSLVIDTGSGWATHPEVAWQQVQLDMADANLKKAKASRLPTLGAVYQYNYNWAMTGFVDFGNASHLPQQYVGLKLNMPIFTGFATKQKIIQSQFAVQQQELQLENIRITEDKQDEIMVIQYKQTSDRLQKSKNILALQNRNDFHYTNQYKSGLISLDMRLTKYKDLISAQNDYLQSLADYRFSEYKLYIRQLNYQP